MLYETLQTASGLSQASVPAGHVLIVPEQTSDGLVLKGILPSGSVVSVSDPRLDGVSAALSALQNPSA